MKILSSEDLLNCLIVYDEFSNRVQIRNWLQHVFKFYAASSVVSVSPDGYLIKSGDDVATINQSLDRYETSSDKLRTGCDFVMQYVKNVYEEDFRKQDRELMF